MSTETVVFPNVIRERMEEALAAEPAPDLRFGPAPGNTMSPPWAAHMLTLWFQAQGSRLSFSDAVKATAVHFMVEGETETTSARR